MVLRYHEKVESHGERMRRTALIILVLVAAAGVAGLVWWLTHRSVGSQEIVIYGNVDLRQVMLAFNNSERIASVLLEEGDRVYKGQVLAKLDTSRLEPLVAQAEAQAATQRHVVEKLRHGSRPEEIAQAKANVDLAEADSANTRRKFERLKNLSEDTPGAVSKQDLDDAKAAASVAEAKLVVSQKALDLSLAGPRIEEIAQAEAQLQSNEAQLAYLRQQLADAVLVAPRDAVVRTRLMEPGEMSSPQKPVFSLAITDPKWVRAYVSEPDLGKVHDGMAATIAVDSFPGKRFEGWVGFISPVAEFTPKAVQTTELRTSLVYEVKVYVKDPGDELRLGMPATVYLWLMDAAP
jgi:HlyD family secretion protein